MEMMWSSRTAWRLFCKRDVRIANFSLFAATQLLSAHEKALPSSVHKNRQVNCNHVEKKISVQMVEIVLYFIRDQVNRENKFFRAGCNSLPAV